ncbi:hypothetical protein MPH_06182 [Macrophomina phaseolina MS6]|uniref:Indole-diterpene biosynthesis protein PaxU n=1 Tax=Macrophomina phaseolina (strain MS6) TaxID=1126212 RepID=K2R2V9_MACPH|nr:hypothetical protein MPH_06182 [Macrophomina phaseolina MS6]
MPMVEMRGVCWACMLKQQTTRAFRRTLLAPASPFFSTTLKPFRLRQRNRLESFPIMDDAAPVFSRLGPRISLYTPPDSEPGQLIILCTWLGAAKKHITKYTELYRRISPGARILLVESAVPILVSSYPRQREAIKPAVQAVRAVLEECGYGKLAEDATPSADGIHTRILLHTFSNGGTNSATQLLLVLQEQLRRPLPLLGLVCDSGPAKGTYWKSYNAMVLSLPKDAASRIVGPVAVHIILCLLYTFIACGRYGKPEDLIRETLLGEATVQGGGQSGELRACYIFSKADKMVEWTDVTDHADTARSKGWLVKELLFEDSGHCNHLSKHEQEYFHAIQDMWKGSYANGGSPRQGASKL